MIYFRDNEAQKSSLIHHENLVSNKECVRQQTLNWCHKCGRFLPSINLVKIIHYSLCSCHL